MRLKIQSPGATGRSGRIWIDDVERSNDVVSVQLSLGVNQITRAIIEFIVRDGVDLDIAAQDDAPGSLSEPTA